MEIFRQMGVNQTLFLMMGVFVVTYLFCSLVALRRARDVVVERHRRTEGREHKIQELQEEASKLSADLEVQLRKIRLENAGILAEARNKAQDEAKRLLGSAREKALTQVNEARARVQQQVQAESQKLQREIPEIARLILSRITGKGSSKSSGAQAVTGA